MPLVRHEKKRPPTHSVPKISVGKTEGAHTKKEPLSNSEKTKSGEKRGANVSGTLPQPE